MLAAVARDNLALAVAFCFGLILLWCGVVLAKAAVPNARSTVTLTATGVTIRGGLTGKGDRQEITYPCGHIKDIHALRDGRACKLSLTLTDGSTDATRGRYRPEALNTVAAQFRRALASAPNPAQMITSKAQT